MSELQPVREILLWDCPKCGGKNRTAIPTRPNHKYRCQHCQRASELDSLAGTSWQLARSADCPDCSGSSVVLAGYVRACGLCQWSDAELAYKPGTTVLYVPRYAKGDLNHIAVNSGVVVKESKSQSAVFVCYASDGGMQDTAELTPKKDLYLHRWMPHESAMRFVELREKERASNS